MKTTEYEALRESLAWFKKKNSIHSIYVRRSRLISIVFDDNEFDDNEWNARDGNGNVICSLLPNGSPELHIWKELLEMSRSTDVTIMPRTRRVLLEKGSSAESILVSRDIEA